MSNLFSIKYIHLARSVTEPDPSGRILITGAGSPNWNSFWPVTKVPDTLIEVNGSKISKSDPQPTFLSTGDDLVYPVRRFSALGHRKVIKFRAALMPDSGSAAPPDVAV